MAGLCGERFIRRESFYIESRMRVIRMRVMDTRVRISGDVRALSSVIYHDDRKSLSCWLASQQRYAQLEADFRQSGLPMAMAKYCA
jgi:secreted Zn-dependent insulinase-like peptidase